MFRYMGYRELWLRGRLSHVCRGLSLEVGQGERGMSMLACILRLSAISLALADGVMCQWQLFKFASASSSDLWLRVLCDGQTTISAHGAAQRSSSEKQLSIRYTDARRGLAPAARRSSLQLLTSVGTFRVVWHMVCGRFRVYIMLTAVP